MINYVAYCILLQSIEVVTWNVALVNGLSSKRKQSSSDGLNSIAPCSLRLLFGKPSGVLFFYKQMKVLIFR